MKHVVIVGGGISGLATAYYLSQTSKAQSNPIQITVLEAKDGFGGVIQSFQENGFVCEGGPDAFVTTKPEAMLLCKELGLEDALIPTQEDYKRSFVLKGEKLIPVPKGFYLLAPDQWSTLWKTELMSLKGKLRFACERWLPARKHSEDESVASFVRRRFGPEALERIGQPMIGGIYTADPEKLSLEATFPRFLEMEREYGSVLKAFLEQKSQAIAESSGPRYSLFVSLKEGMQTLVDALMQACPEVEFRSGTALTTLERGTRWQLGLQSGEMLEADSVCLALTAPRAAALCAPVAPELSEALSGLEYMSVATVNLGFSRDQVEHPLDGFGFVVPACENKPIVGCTFSHRKFQGRAGDDDVLLRAFVGGALQQGMLECSDQVLVEKVLACLKPLLGIEGVPIHTRVSRYEAAMPQYYVGHLKYVEQIEQLVAQIPGLELTGNGYRGMGIPDCVRVAQKTAERVLVSIAESQG